MRKKYVVNCWIPIEDRKEWTFKTRKEAEKELEQAELIQPENKYEIEVLE